MAHKLVKELIANLITELACKREAFGINGTIALHKVVKFGHQTQPQRLIGSLFRKDSLLVVPDKLQLPVKLFNLRGKSLIVLVRLLLKSLNELRELVN